MSGKRNISYVQNEEPSFIKAFKQKVGYKEGPTIDSKREELRYEEVEREDREDEKPQIVVLRDGDLTTEEASRLDAPHRDEAGIYDTDEEPPSDGKVLFKKPKKRSCDASSDLKVSSSIQSKEKKVTKSAVKQVRNSSLLSFDDEEGDT